MGGTGSLTSVLIADNVPAGTTYEPGTLTLQGGPLSDAADADAGRFVAPAAGPPAVPGRIEVGLGSVSAGQTRTVTFRVRIN